MSNLIQNVLSGCEKNHLREFASLLRQSEKRYLVRTDILIAFYKYCDINEDNKDLYRDSDLGKLIYSIQEIILDKQSLYLVISPKMATQEAYRLLHDLTLEPMDIQELLNLRDKLVDSKHSQDDVLKIDFQAFYDSSPSLRDSKKIGNGVDYLNRYLSSKLFDGNCGNWQEALFNFLKMHKYNGQQLLINERIKSKSQLSEKVKRVIDLLDKYPDRTSHENFRFELRSFGFEPGWGNTAARAKESFLLLDRLIDSADREVLEKFMARIPLIFKVLVTSPHRWFGENVLSTPDTGGQIVYILDWVKELEKQIEENAKLGGLDVLGKIEPKIIVLTRLIPNSEDSNCDFPSETLRERRLEKIDGSNNCWILRVPFRESQPEITQSWISRFEIYPYLEPFAIDSERELLAEFQGNPDLIIGNYTDENLVLSTTSIGKTSKSNTVSHLNSLPI